METRIRYDEAADALYPKAKEGKVDGSFEISKGMTVEILDFSKRNR